jgi:hypothetical protein
MRRYEPKSEWAKAVYGPDEFEAEFTEVDERDLVVAGHVGVVPASYVVLSDNFAGGALDDTYVAALTMAEEAMLVGHLKRVDAEPSTEAPPKKRAAKKAPATNRKD